MQINDEKICQNDSFLNHKKDNENDDENNYDNNNENDNKICPKIWENFKPILIHRLKNISELNEQKNANKGIGHRNKEKLGKNDSFSLNNRCVISLKKSIIDDSQFKNNNMSNNDNNDNTDINNNNNNNNDDDNNNNNNNNDKNDDNNNNKNGNDNHKDSYNYHIYYNNIRNDDGDDKNRKKNQRFSGKKNIVNRKTNNFRPNSAPVLINRKVNEINGGHHVDNIVDKTSDKEFNCSNYEKDENQDEKKFYQVK